MSWAHLPLAGQSLWLVLDLLSISRAAEGPGVNGQCITQFNIFIQLFCPLPCQCYLIASYKVAPPLYPCRYNSCVDLVNSRLSSFDLFVSEATCVQCCVIQLLFNEWSGSRNIKYLHILFYYCCYQQQGGPEITVTNVIRVENRMLHYKFDCCLDNKLSQRPYCDTVTRCVYITHTHTLICVVLCLQQEWIQAIP